MDASWIAVFSTGLDRIEAVDADPNRSLRVTCVPYPDPAHPDALDLEQVSGASLVVIDFRRDLDRATLVYDLLVLGNPHPVPPCLLIASPATVHWVERCIAPTRDWIVQLPLTQNHLTVSLPGHRGRERRQRPRLPWPDIDLYLGEICDDGPAIVKARGVDASPNAILLDSELRYHAGQGVCVRIKSDMFWAVGSGIIARSARRDDGWRRYLVTNLDIHDGDADWFEHLAAR